MIDLCNLSDFDAPLYAYDFRTRTLFTFDGKEVTGGDAPVLKVWAMQPLRSFLSSIKPIAFWSPSPSEAVAPYIFARSGVWMFRFSRIDYMLSKKKGLKGVFGVGSFTSPEDLESISPFWFATIIEAYHWDTA